MIRRSFSSAIVSSSRQALLLILAAALCPGATTSPSADLVERAGQRVKQFWDELSSVACTETLLQERLNQKGKVAFDSRSSYDYLITMRLDASGLLVDESRLLIGQQKKKSAQSSLLVTQGFSTLLLIFHPEFQRGYSFTVEGNEALAGKMLVRVSFVPHNGAASPAALSLKDRTYPIAWEGIALLDPQTATIHRIQAHWKEPAKDLPIQSLSSEVEYAPMSFKESPKTMWLPESARIEVKTLHQEWRNTHEFSNYRLFSVEAQEKIGAANQ
jgi:hypothetical protein